MFSNLQSALPDAFRRVGLRVTAQRFAVLEYLSSQPVHATAEEVFRAVNRTDPRSSRATVYNSLRSLAQAGLVREVEADGGAARFESGLRPHHHFVCSRCGALEDVAWFEMPAEAAEALSGRQVSDFQVVFRGVCAGCQAGAQKGPRS